MGILQFESVNCKDCCKCIGVCPVKAIEVKNHRAMVVERDCILCGNCTVVCPQNTKHDVNDVAGVRALIHDGRKVIASVAPSYAAYFNGCGLGALRAALQKLGFSDVRETAEGAYLVKSEYEALLREKHPSTVISSCCTTVNAYVQKHCPEAISLLAPVLTPMQAHAKLIHAEDPEAVLVFIGPCISKKAECEEDASDLAYAITFGDLAEWMRDMNIEIEPASDADRRLSRFFPVTGGILKTMEKQPDYSYLAVDGPENCMRALHDAAAGKFPNCFIEMSFCTGSCVGGPVFRKRELSLAASTLRVARDAVENDIAEHGAPDYAYAKPGNLSASFRDEQICYAMPTEKQIAAVFKKMGKESPEDELNCGMCGYPSCREKAIAVLMGRAEITMCMPYMKKRAESFSDKILSITPDAILAVDLDLKVQQVNDAACKIFSLEPQDILGQPVSRLIDEFDFVDLISSGNTQSEKFTFLAEYNLYLKQSFFYDATSGIIICIMKNITKEKQKQNQLMRHKTQVAGMADDIVEKQLRIVHEIASLLGESAAETKLAISELKDAVMMENEEQ